MDKPILKPETVTAIAETAIDEIMDTGLADSTWRETYPTAYKALLFYREDLRTSVEMAVMRHTRIKVDL